MTYDGFIQPFIAIDHQEPGKQNYLNLYLLSLTYVRYYGNVHYVVNI
jgi:hypothetical protein